MFHTKRYWRINNTNPKWRSKESEGNFMTKLKYRPANLLISGNAIARCFQMKWATIDLNGFQKEPINIFEIINGF